MNNAELEIKEKAEELPTFLKKAALLLIRHEGFSKLPYVDTLGNITIGVGYNLAARGLPTDYLFDLFVSDLEYFYRKLIQYDWFYNLNESRQLVILDMSFMGLKKLLTFEKMIYSLNKGDFNNAAYEMLDSKWAKQVKSRALELAEIMKEGVIGDEYF